MRKGSTVVKDPQLAKVYGSVIRMAGKLLPNNPATSQETSFYIIGDPRLLTSIMLVEQL
jgi:hypothetical protein